MNTVTTYGSRFIRPAVLLSLIVFTFVLFSQPQAAEATDTSIDVADIFFSPNAPVIQAGDKVTWNWVGILPHNVVECGPNWNKGLTCTGADWTSATQTSGSFNRPFNTPGVTYYLCTVHPTTMRGTITVASAVGGIAELPSATAFSIESPNSSSDGQRVLIALAAGGALAVAALGGGLWYMRRRLA
ncbi:MAG: hypothetical protein J4N98_01640 [Chloroflexi bacterium]|nr:hypothetical protein [Chloroflexota bacterium]